MISTEVRRSELYNTLAWMGLLSTEEYRIREVRSSTFDRYVDLDINYDDIERVGYFYPHVGMPLGYEGLTELWCDGVYFNPESLEWIKTTNQLYAVLNKKVDDKKPLHAFVNPGIIHRYSKIVEDDGDYIHTVSIDTTELRYSEIDHIEHCAYYISENQYHIPDHEWMDEDHTILRFSAPYKHDIDFFICSNIITVQEVKAGKSLLLDHLQSNRCYHRIFVDDSPSYPIDARFYPYICVDKDCVVRVFDDNYHTVLYPEICRLMLYPEFLEIDDPYNSDNEYLRSLPQIDDHILASDTDDEILQKFTTIASYFYRLWEKYPIDTTEQSDFIICDNTRLAEKAFKVDNIDLDKGAADRIISLVPAEPYRELIFYNGYIFSDYEIHSMYYNKSTDHYSENHENGVDRYIISTDYDVDRLSVIKFNANEDTIIVNAGEYFDTKNVLQLHHKLNRFYRNLMVLRMQILDQELQDEVRIGTEEPGTRDGHIWFELLINAQPEMFATKAIDTINLLQLDPETMPRAIKEGAYMLELDPEAGPASYHKLVMTYFELTDYYKDQLVLQYGDGIPDPRVQIMNKIKVGELPTEEELNQLQIELNSPSPAYTETSITHGYKDVPPPKNPDYVDGDLYVQSPPPVYPENPNTTYERIESGFMTPTEDKEKTLWLEMEQGDQLPPRNSMDSVNNGNSVLVTNDTAEHTAPVGGYAFDAVNDDIPAEEEGNYDIHTDFGTDDGTISTGDLDDLLSEETRDPDENGTSEDFLNQVQRAVAKNITVNSVVDPTVGQIALDKISFVNQETGEQITMEQIAELPTDLKLSIVGQYMINNDDDEPVRRNIGDLWLHYASSDDPAMLNDVVYHILFTQQLLNIGDPREGTLAIEIDSLLADDPEEDQVVLGPDSRKLTNNQILLHTDFSEDGTPIPDYDKITEMAVRYIMSPHQPDTKWDLEVGTLWLAIPAVVKRRVIGGVIEDVVAKFSYEVGKNMPEGYYEDDGIDVKSSFGLDYVPHDTGTEGLGDLFRVRKDPTLYPIHYGGEQPDIGEGDTDILWYEFLDDIDNRVAYSDPNTMIIRVDERLIMVKFDHEDIQAFAFDDIMINFKGKLGVKYLSIIADLIDSGELKLDEVDLFYKRLVTHGDDFDPALKRLYTGTSHVVATANIDTTDCAVYYSTNVGRFHIYYAEDSTSSNEREAAYEHVIDFHEHDFVFLNRRMLLFVNGRYIPTNEYEELADGRIQLLNFDEIISTVDILYSKHDEALMHIKKKALVYHQIDIATRKIKRPSHYGVMEPIKVIDRTKRGYYDILLEEYIYNGKLERILAYLEEHPDEAEEFRSDLVRKFHAISDIDLSGMTYDQSRIVISGSGNNPTYQVGTSN